MAVDALIQAALDAPLRDKASKDTVVPRKERAARGYGGIAGTGPIGKTCFNCRDCAPTGNDYRNWFCDRPVRAWERGTFIDRNTRACARYAPRSRDRE